MILKFLIRNTLRLSLKGVTRNMSSNLRQNIVFMDMEMTGLDVNKDRILEIGCVITDADLNKISDPLHLIINQSNSVLDNMNEWCKENLKELRLECEKSKISEQEAGNILLDYLKSHVDEKTCPLAGNSIWMDRLFLRTYYPVVDDYLHYRIIDVSTIKELCKRWNQKCFYKTPKKALKHRAVDDINETIEELKYYKDNFLIVL